MPRKTKIYAPVADFSGKVAGVSFVDGKGETDSARALNYFARHGYGIGKPPENRTTAVRDAADSPHAAATTRQPIGPAGDDPNAFDPSKHSVEDVNAHLEQADEAERERVLTAEAAGKARKTILEGAHATPEGDGS